MYKIAAFFEFNAKINKKILSEKNKVKKKFGNQIYLNHPVHLTLFTLNILKISELRKIYSQKKIIYKKPLSIKFDKPGIFYNDPLTNGHTIFYHVKKNKKLHEIQLRNLKEINKKINVIKNEKYSFNNKTLRKNYMKFGFPFAGNIWIPHITIASINKNKKSEPFLKKFLNSKINLKCFVNELSFYKINKNEHKFLFRVKNF